MQHAIINDMKCMRAIKGRIARPVNQLANHLNRASIPRTMYQPGKSSVHDLQSPSAHNSSVVFRHNQSVGHHSDDIVGLFRNDTSVGQSQRGSKSGHQSICQSGSRCMHLLYTKSSDNETGGILQQKPAATIRRCISLHAPKRRRINYSTRRRSVPTADDRFLPKPPKIRLLTQSVTTQNDVASGTRHPRCQQLIKPTSGHTNNANDDVRDTSPSLPTAGHKALHPKLCVPTYQNDVALPSAAGHSNQQLVARLNQFLTNAAADSATISAVNTKKFTNTCRFLVKSRDCAPAASRYLLKRYY
ncbi:hypothetical protein F511_10378 [Dorcoceras hygrometricum]|uniref:Uncharacterized protein n=1 Tax=Dorcoceras hygrometricum TaxID=472368 RepID=A0A2Z7CHY2_9LAMI|nr:hypothetical protein F511_10378 [Dorcoceras hygrometricum]